MENYRKFFKVVATVAFIGMVLFSNMLGIKMFTHTIPPLPTTAKIKNFMLREDMLL
ncbi:hypothetical protein [Enterococcus cecorum]|uniref:hypothetical protein n=1 Tax=Enterococcus cecorum TaxID=44008 RepID=UPI002491B3F2|nr:hypothetical protein [Enterococcus cecorum]CAI3266892.1 hypothetical protein CIRMBP1281_00205 [Enterococcus cecorum]